MKVTTIPFRMEISGGGEKSQSSKLIAAPFTILEILLIFPANTSNKLVYRFFLSTAYKVPDTGTPGGRDVFDDLIEKGEFVGENLTYSIPVQKTVKDESKFIQMYSQNGVASTLIAAAYVIVGVPE